ncbi:hypothetical protein [Nocardiopsis composta]|uniref:Uncharacterized protein n=1 Tax=Nocardiopsis composta TaxID=157465 RepID=A0A7W8QUV1_9ACTN|nr:hypothetical protein [Nocardiopsis composta]MBB5436086.1 hypothetical protein [Nocardiopsis composta]
MAEPSHGGRRTSTRMPPYRAVLAVDAEEYPRASSYNRRILHNTVRDALEQAFADSGLEEVWRTASFPRSGDDGYAVGVDSEYLPLLLHPLLGEVQEVLGDMQPGLAFEDRSLRLRLRAAIGLGPLPDGCGRERGDGIGAAVAETRRLLAAPALEKALADTDPDVTFLVAGLTARVHRDAVLGGYVGLNPRRFQRVAPALPPGGGGGSAGDAYLYIPRPSKRPPGAQDGSGAARGGPDARPRGRTGAALFGAAAEERK